MSHWPAVPLGSVVEFLDHLRKPVTASDRVDGPYPYYGANGQQGNIDGYLFDEPLLLLAEDGGHFDNPARGIAYRISGKSWVNNHAHVLRMTPALDLDYASAALAKMDVRKYITGTTRSKLTKAGAARIEIPLPPLDEQRRIAAILDQADVLRGKRCQVVQNLDNLRALIFSEMFGDPFRDAGGREMVRLADCSRLENGDRSSKYPKSDDLVSAGVPFLSTKNIRDGRLDWRDTQFISEQKFASLTQGKAVRGDVLITLCGTLGSTCIYDGCFTTAFINAQMMIIRPQRLIRSEFLHAALSSRSARRLFDSLGRGGAVPQLTMKQISEIQIAVPDKSEQDDFVARLAQAEAANHLANAQLAVLDTFLVSLQSRAFAGKL